MAHLIDLATPRVLIDRARLLANIARMQATAASHGLALRPHTKTHKSPRVAHWQIEHGAAGICCAKLGEAEVFADAGLGDIRLPYPINPSNAARVVALMDRVALSIIVDHADVASHWSNVMQEAGRRLDVLVKVDVGYHRCGIDPESSGAVAFLRRIADLPGLRLRGLLSHAGQGYEARSEAELAAIARAEAKTLNDLAAAARGAGVPIDEISVGSTATAHYSAGESGLTELRPGNYVYYDRTQVALGSTTLDDCALSVLATVVSKPSRDRIILDCGSKTLTSDAARGFVQPTGHGAVFPQPEATRPDDTLCIERLSEEHAVVRAQRGTTPLEPGHRVRVLPNHACVVSNLVDTVCLVDGLTVLEELPVAARGRIT